MPALFRPGRFGPGAPPDLEDRAWTQLAPPDQQRLWDAAHRLISARGSAMRATTWVSRNVLGATSDLDMLGQRVFGARWHAVEDTVQSALQTLLLKAHDFAIIGVSGGRKPGAALWMNRIGASASGAASGFAGLPGLLADIPVTTALMLRSIAVIARDHGEDIGGGESRRACLEVLALDHSGAGGADPEIGYWSTRLGLERIKLDALIRAAATRLGVALSQKALARIVPVAGAVAGGGLNWMFMGYYQDMAHVHFTLRAVERRTGGSDEVRPSFDRLVDHARAERRRRMPWTARRNGPS